MGSCVPFVFSLGHPWSVCFLWASSSLLLTLHFHELLLISLGFPDLITLFLSLGFMSLPLTHYFLCLHYFWACSGPFSLFLHYILPMGMLFLSFRASLSPFTSSKAHLFISWTCDPSFLPLGPDGFATCLPNLCYPCCWAFCLSLGSSKMTLNTCFNFSNRDSKDSNLYSLNNWIPKIIILPSLQPKLMFIISFSQIIQL